MSDSLDTYSSRFHNYVLSSIRRNGERQVTRCTRWFYPESITNWQFVFQQYQKSVGIKKSLDSNPTSNQQVYFQTLLHFVWIFCFCFVHFLLDTKIWPCGFTVYVLCLQIFFSSDAFPLGNLNLLGKKLKRAQKQDGACALPAFVLTRFYVKKRDVKLRKRFFWLSRWLFTVCT